MNFAYRNTLFMIMMKLAILVIAIVFFGDIYKKPVADALVTKFPGVAPIYSIQGDRFYPGLGFRKTPEIREIENSLYNSAPYGVRCMEGYLTKFFGYIALDEACKELGQKRLDWGIKLASLYRQEFDRYVIEETQILKKQ